MAPLTRKQRRDAVVKENGGGGEEERGVLAVLEEVVRERVVGEQAEKRQEGETGTEGYGVESTAVAGKAEEISEELPGTAMLADSVEDTEMEDTSPEFNAPASSQPRENSVDRAREERKLLETAWKKDRTKSIDTVLRFDLAEPEDPESASETDPLAHLDVDPAERDFMLSLLQDAPAEEISQLLDLPSVDRAPLEKRRKLERFARKHGLYALDAHTAVQAQLWGDAMRDYAELVGLGKEMAQVEVGRVTAMWKHARGLPGGDGWEDTLLEMDHVADHVADALDQETKSVVSRSVTSVSATLPPRETEKETAAVPVVKESLLSTIETTQSAPGKRKRKRGQAAPTTSAGRSGNTLDNEANDKSGSPSERSAEPEHDAKRQKREAKQMEWTAELDEKKRLAAMIAHAKASVSKALGKTPEKKKPLEIRPGPKLPDYIIPKLRDLVREAEAGGVPSKSARKRASKQEKKAQALAEAAKASASSVAASQSGDTEMLDAGADEAIVATATEGPSKPKRKRNRKPKSATEQAEQQQQQQQPSVDLDPKVEAKRVARREEKKRRKKIAKERNAIARNAAVQEAVRPDGEQSRDEVVVDEVIVNGDDADAKAEEGPPKRRRKRTRGGRNKKNGADLSTDAPVADAEEAASAEVLVGTDVLADGATPAEEPPAKRRKRTRGNRSGKKVEAETTDDAPALVNGHADAMDIDVAADNQVIAEPLSEISEGNSKKPRRKRKSKGAEVQVDGPVDVEVNSVPHVPILDLKPAKAYYS